jgi:hypothetical protein
MSRCYALIATLAVGLASIGDAAAQPAGAPSGSAGVTRSRMFNPFAPFSFSRLTANPFGLPQIGRLPVARVTTPAPAAAPASGSTGATSAADGLEEGAPNVALAVRPPYRPPLRSPYRPPPRPPF